MAEERQTEPDLFKIALINMPFADASRPSLSMTQLKSIVSRRHPVEVDVHYFNQEFCKLYGWDLFHFVSGQYMAGLGDWLFRHIAFPDAPDNTEQYLRRYFPKNDPETRRLKERLLEMRDATDAALDKLIAEFNIGDADLVGLSSMFSQNAACFALAKKLKRINPDVTIVMGGANCESPMGEQIVKNVAQVDFVFSGPALVSFPELVGYLIDGNHAACHNIQGVFSRRNTPLLTPARLAGREMPLDEYIPLDYRPFIETYDRNFPEHKGEKLLLFETSRGCWWGERSHCTFCGLNSESMGFRSMTPEVAVRQFEAMFSYADYCTHFSSVDNILPQKYTRDVFPQLHPPEHISIFYEVKSSLKEQELALLSEKRVKRVQPGIEALNTSTLQLMKKGTTAFANITFLMNCGLYDILPEWNLLVGFPGEKEDVFRKYMADLPLLFHLPPPVNCFPVRFDRYSPYFTRAGEYGLDLQPFRFYRDVYPFSDESIRNIAYYFDDHNFSASYISAMIDWIGPLRQQIESWNARWQGADGTCHPELYFAEPDLVLDSRNGTAVEHRISDVSRRVLDALSKPKTPALLASTLADLPGFDADREIAMLRAKGFLFEEEGRYLNVVFPRRGSRLRQQVHWSMELPGARKRAEDEPAQPVTQQPPAASVA